MANSIKNLLQGYTKGIRFVAVLTLLLTMGIGQAWGEDFQGQGTNAGWISGANDEGLILSWSKNSSSATTKMKYSTLSSGGNLGDITTGLTLTKFEAKFWRVYAYGNICDATLFWELYKGNSKISNGSESSTSFGSWSGNNCSISKTLSIDFLSKTTGPGSYTIRIYGKLTGRSQNNKYDDPSYLGCGDNFWYNNNNSGYYSITFTIPSKNLTVAGAANGNTVSGTVAGITKGKAYTITATPTTGYSFSKWTASSGASSITIANANAASTIVTFKDYVNNATVTASFSAKTYTVTLNNSGATTAGQASVTATYNAAMPSIANNLPKKTGYTFNGYFDAASGGTQYYKADGTSARTWNKTANTTLYAQWKEQTFHLAGSMNGWNTSSNPMTISDGKATCTLILAKGLYDFKIVESGETWRTASTTPRTINRNSNNLEFKTKGGNDNNTSITADVEGTADYVFNYDIANEKLTVIYPAAYTVTYGVGNTKGTTSVITSPSITSGSLVLPSTSITFSKGETKAGYQWKNWNSKADGSGTDLGTGDTYVSSNREADITVYACYDLITYNITYNLDGGSGTISPTTYNVESATITLPTDLTKTGHTFAGWYDNASFSGTAVTQITNGSTGDKTLYAKWTLNTYTVKWYVNGEELTGAATTVNHGGKVTTIPEVDLNTYCEGSDVLAGWTTAPMENASVKAPAQLYKTIDDFPTAEGPQTYYAVFANYKE